VNVHASSVNFTDYAACSGLLPIATGRIPLVDGAGIVSKVGPGVEDVAVGDSVVAVFYPNWTDGAPTEANRVNTAGIDIDGYGCEQVVMPAAAFTRAPEGWTHAEAATLTCAGVTAWRALVTKGKVSAGEWVLVQGTGGVATYALLIAKAMGARVVATSSSEEKLERLSALGADEVINYREEPKWGSHARETTGGVDHVVDVGGEQTLAQSLEAVRIGGSIYTVGILGGLVFPLSIRDMMQRDIRLLGGSVGSRADQLAMVEGMERHNVRPALDRSFDLADLADAFHHQRAQKQVGKIVITIR
jgi:NADPH:quinone reductase-like Zn-dependent oxidoreductase